MPKRNLFIISIVFGMLLSLKSCVVVTQDNSEKLATRIEHRNNVVRKYVSSDLKIGQQYIDFGFGKEDLIKPLSFKKLDSLYTLYNLEEKKPVASRNVLLNLKSEIELERQKVLQDTIHFLYEKPHFFGQSKRDSTTITFANFRLNAQNKVIKVTFNYYFITPSRSNQFYRCYLNKESFIEFGFEPSVEETKFYDFFDNMNNTLTDPELKGRFVEHTLQIMRAANQQGGLKTESLIKQHVINTITQNVKGYKSIKWSKVYTNLSATDDLLSYEVDHEWTYTDLTGQSHSMKRLFVLNPYFEIIEASETSTIRN